jgi:lambda family phage portal protein
MVESGEIVLRFIDQQLDDKLAVPLKLQLLEADFIDHFREGVFAIDANQQAAGVVRNRLGVGLGKFDEWRGLWLWPRHPGEMQAILDTRNFMSEFIERDQLVHMFKRERPGQVRGVPWFAPILTTARDLADLLDAANVKARVEACFAGFIINSDESLPLLDDNGQGGDLSLPNAMGSTLEPGMLKELRSGQDIKFAAPTSTSQLDTMLISNLQAMAAGVGCTYDQATGDLRQANYSSLRAGKIEFWRLIGKLQQHVVIHQFCKPIWNKFTDRAVLAGRLPARTQGYPCRWVVPAKEMIDPKKDFDAIKNLVRAGAMTPQEFIASFGGDWRNSIGDFKSFFDLCKENGVIFDIDVAHVDQHGRQPSKGGDEVQGKVDDATDDAEDGDDDVDEAA